MSAVAAMAVSLCALAVLAAIFAGALWSAYQKGWVAGQDEAGRRWAEEDRQEAVDALERERDAADELQKAQARLRRASADVSGISTDDLLGRVFAPLPEDGPGEGGGRGPDDPAEALPSLDSGGGAAT